jgi:hypothetical protein
VVHRPGAAQWSLKCLQMEFNQVVKPNYFPTSILETTSFNLTRLWSVLMITSVLVYLGGDPVFSVGTSSRTEMRGRNAGGITHIGLDTVYLARGGHTPRPSMCRQFNGIAGVERVPPRTRLCKGERGRIKHLKLVSCAVQ